MSVAATRIRPSTPQDARALTALLRAGRDGHLRDSFPPGYLDDVDEASQQAALERADEAHRLGRRWSGVIVAAATGEVVGRVTLNDIVRGHRRSCFVGYWVGEEHTGAGHATRALGAACDVAFADLGLHRVEAFVRPGNAASLAVVRRCGFEYVGLARRHTLVGDDWQDETLWQLLEPADR